METFHLTHTDGIRIYPNVVMLYLDIRTIKCFSYCTCGSVSKYH